MCGDGCCDDPTDVSLLVLKVFAKCLGGDVGFVFYMCRCVTGLALDFAECVILVTEILAVFSEDNTTLKIVTMLVMVLLFVGSIATLGWIGGGVIRVSADEDDKQRALNKFFLVFKLINVVFVVALTAGTIYGWENLDIENLFEEPIDGAKVFFVVSLGIDILMDPIELLIACCVACRNC